MKKLLKLLIVFVVMFGFSGMVMAYDKPNGKFYRTFDNKLHILDREISHEENDNPYVLTEEFANILIKDGIYSTPQKQEKSEACYIKNMPKSTKYVYFKYNDAYSKGDTLMRAWKQLEKENNDNIHRYMVGCYRTSLSVESPKYRFIGYFSESEKYNYVFGKSCKVASTAVAYVKAGTSSTDKDKDLEYGYGWPDGWNGVGELGKTYTTIGASWACQGKKAKDFKDCISDNGSKLTDRKSCPMYAGAKTDGLPYYYLTNNTETDFKYSGYQKLCVAYDYELESNIKSATDSFYKEFSDKNAYIEGNVKLSNSKMLNVYQVVSDYKTGKISLAKFQLKYSEMMNYIIKNVISRTSSSGDKIYDEIDWKTGDVILTEFGKTFCGDYLDYLNDQIKLSRFNEKIKEEFIKGCISDNDSKKINDVKKLLPNGEFILEESDLNNINGITETEKTCLLNTMNAVSKVEQETENKIDDIFAGWIKSAEEFLKNGFTGPGIDPKDLTCEEMLGKNLTKILKFALEVLSIAGAIIAIVNSMISLIPALIAKDAEALKKAQSKCITMAIVLVLILLLPTLLTFMGKIFGYDLTCFNWMK